MVVVVGVVDGKRADGWFPYFLAKRVLQSAIIVVF